MCVVVEGDTIIFVGTQQEWEQSHPRTPSYTELDAQGATLLPGLIDGHCHLTLDAAGDPAWPGYDGPREQLVLFALHSAQQALAAGITTLADAGCVADVSLQVRDAIARGCAIGPRILAAGRAITTTAGHGDYLNIGELADNADELKTAVRTWVKRGADFIKIMATGGFTDPATNRRRAQYSAAEMRAGTEDAHRLGKRVVAHVNATEGIINSVEAGVDALAHCNWLGSAEGTIEYLPEVAAAAGRKGISIDLNIFGALRPFATTSDGNAQDWSTPGAPQCRWHLVVDMEKRGCKAYFTSDHMGKAIAEFPAKLVEACETLKLDPVDVVFRATGRAAEGLWLKDVGTIAVGKKADLLLVDGNLAQDISALLHVRAVLRSGRVIVRDGRWLLAAL